MRPEEHSMYGETGNVKSATRSSNELQRINNNNIKL